MAEGIDQANALAEAQLTIQATFITNLDARAVGYLGVSLALVALDITFRDGIGPVWWLPCVGFVIAAVLGILALTPLRFQLGPHLPDMSAAGAVFPALAAYDSLRAAVARNTAELGYKRRVLFWTAILLLVSSLISILLFLITKR
ncbi:MAG TPA: hypothetical protein VFR68_05040 [Candidatus Dormibacteraeota bacterium]|nr:hypothetical protein [Candidatus Dormibacteraeota bacterium]